MQFSTVSSEGNELSSGKRRCRLECFGLTQIAEARFEAAVVLETRIGLP